MSTIHNPPTVHPPAGYSHAIETPAAARWLHIAGQVGQRPDGIIVEGAGAQADQCWANIRALLQSAGMTMADLVKITTFIVDDVDLAAVRAARERAVGERKPASSLVIVKKLAHPAWLVEIEAIAAKA